MEAASLRKNPSPAASASRFSLKGISATSTSPLRSIASRAEASVRRRSTTVR